MYLLDVINYRYLLHSDMGLYPIPLSVLALHVAQTCSNPEHTVERSIRLCPRSPACLVSGSCPSEGYQQWASSHVVGLNNVRLLSHCYGNILNHSPGYWRPRGTPQRLMGKLKWSLLSLILGKCSKCNLRYRYCVYICKIFQKQI